ncbi:MAG: hypothetical protein AAF496_05630 [Pseudomonadota bacterium]
MANTPYSQKFLLWLGHDSDRQEALEVLARCLLRGLPAATEKSDWGSQDDLLLLLRATLLVCCWSHSTKDETRSTLRSLRIDNIDHNEGQHASTYGDFRRALHCAQKVSLHDSKLSSRDFVSSIHASGNVLDSFDSGVSAFEFQSNLVDLDTSYIQERSASCFSRPLFHNTEPFFMYRRGRSNFLLTIKLFGGTEFWESWYRGFIAGKPLDWELQRRVALIDDAIWQQGPDYVAEEIERIRSRLEVERTLRDVKDRLSVQKIARHGIGGNNPPESIQDEQLSGAITLIWDAAEELSTAMEQESPAREWVEAILARLKSGLASLLKWCAGKVNLAVGTAVVVGTTKGATVVADAYFAKHPEKIEALIKALERWLPFLS